MVLPWCRLKGPLPSSCWVTDFTSVDWCPVSVLPSSAQKRCFLKFPFLVQHKDLLKNKMECGSDEKLKPNNPLENGRSWWSALSEQDFSLYSPPWEMVGHFLGCEPLVETLGKLGCSGRKAHCRRETGTWAAIPSPWVWMWVTCGLDKMQILIQGFWGGASDLHFWPPLQGLWCCWSDHTWKSEIIDRITQVWVFSAIETKVISNCDN